MREILFRGKTDNKWVYGVPIYLHKEAYIVRDFCLGGDYTDDWVEAETVGQFTGLTDKNDNKIFEGDIISAITLDTGKEQTAVVCFGNFIDENNGDEYIGFYIEFDGIKTTAAQLAMKECKNRIEVIGNIYDNPELLDVSEK